MEKTGKTELFAIFCSRTLSDASFLVFLSKWDSLDAGFNEVPFLRNLSAKDWGKPLWLQGFFGPGCAGGHP
jgi:hypothetical protein